MKVSKNFILQEFVPKEIYHIYGEFSKWFIRPEVISLAQFYRDWFDAPVRINNWHRGGELDLRGYRPPHSGLYSEWEPHLNKREREIFLQYLKENPKANKEMLTTGSYLSKHKLGIAFDCTVDGYNADQVREIILDNENKFMEAGLTTLESGDYAPTWVHSDCRSTGLDRIFIVEPR